MWYKKEMTKIVVFIISLILGLHMQAQQTFNDAPLLGAEIFIEPGQSDKDVESWFRILKENNMALTRIRMFESYMKDSAGNWDYSLFDRAFKYADKYGIKVYGNLFPATDFTDVGGFKLPHDESHLGRVAEYIKNVVPHFKKYRSLYGWVPVNEPGGINLNEPLALKLFAEWQLKQHAENQEKNLNTYRHFTFEKQQFLVYANTYYLSWLANEIRKYDTENHVHVNNHQIFENVEEYDFPAWSKFLTSLGGSAHASWHFGYFTREKYAVALSANSEIIRAGAKNIPWLMTELQGGNNIFSGSAPMCPTKEEIDQWTWIALGAGSKGAIYWCLNARASGTEAGEWAMIDFNNKPTDRLLAASRTAAALNKQKELFAHAKPVNSYIHVLYIKEALWVEKKIIPREIAGKRELEARKSGAVMKSALAFFEALSEMGLQPTFEDIEGFDFSKDSFAGETIILANQIALPEKYHDFLREFVIKGGTVIAEGLTAFYNENAVSLMMNDFRLKDFFGGSISEFKFIENDFLPYKNTRIPVQAQVGYIIPGSAEIIASSENKPVAVVNKYGKGKFVWIPSMIALACRVNNAYSYLIDFMSDYINVSKEIRFGQPSANMLMKNMRSGNNIISIIVNKSPVDKTVKIAGLEKRHPKIIFSNKQGSMNNEVISIHSEETMVILWE